MQHVAGEWQLPEGAGFFTRGRMALRAFFAVAKEPGHTSAGPLLNISMDAEVYARRAAELRKTEQGRALLREQRPVLSQTLVQLRALPKGSLGQELARYYAQNGIEPFANTYPVRNDVEYLARRYRELHDPAHILTGYGTDPVGEMELQAFVLGNVGLRNSLLVLTLVALLPVGIAPVWTYASKLRAAYARGRRSQDVLIAAELERLWALPVEEVRTRIGLAAAS